jgi:cobalt/nickel transport system permease protein
MRLDKIAHHSGLKKVDGKCKLSIMFLLLMVVFIGSNCLLNGCIGLMLLVILRKVGKTDLKEIIKFLMIPSSFIFMNILSFAFEVKLGAHVYFTLPGLVLGLRTGFNAMMSMIVVVSFLATTPLPQMLRTFIQFKVPQVLIDIMRLSYPMIFIGYDILFNISRAQKSRLGYSGFRRTYMSLGYLGARLFQRLYQHGIELYQSMLSRGYGKEI